MPLPETPIAVSRPGELRLQGSGAATRYATDLLDSLGSRVVVDPSGPPDVSPERAWADSGAMALTGCADAPPRHAPAPIASCADGAARAFEALARATLGSTQPPLDGAALLGERAATSRPPLTRAGARSPGGSCRLVRCADGWLALNLARADDESLIPAWLEVRPEAPVWPGVERICAERARDALVARGRIMGLAVSPAVVQSPNLRRPPDWQRTTRLGPEHPERQARRDPGTAPLVIDLSSLWAGPLCGGLLAAAGARVVKVESIERPDGARRGARDFFDLLNGDKQSVALPFSEAHGQSTLASLIERADIVIEASRPRALAQLGIDAEAVIARRGTTWIHITGHGRSAPQGDWVAFGDDAAAAGGLLATGPNGQPWFCGDAIADPLTGLHAALAGLSAWSCGGGRLVELALSEVAGWVRGVPFPDGGLSSRDLVARAPRAQRPRRGAPELGADTRQIVAEGGAAC